jgi:hypothetical protein
VWLSDPHALADDISLTCILLEVHNSLHAWQWQWQWSLDFLITPAGYEKILMSLMTDGTGGQPYGMLMKGSGPERKEVPCVCPV